MTSASMYEDGVFPHVRRAWRLPARAGWHQPGSLQLPPPDLGDWKLVNAKAVDPNPDGGHKYGVGDATIAKIGGTLLHLLRPGIKGQPLQGRGLAIQRH